MRMQAELQPSCQMMTFRTVHTGAAPSCRVTFFLHTCTSGMLARALALSFAGGRIVATKREVEEIVAPHF